jgi:hypothetical protein
MPGPCAEKCQLAEDSAIIKADMAEVKAKQQETHDSTLRMEVGQTNMMDKLEDFMTDQKDKNKTFYERTRWVVTWKGFALLAAGGLSAAYTVILIAEKIGG